MLSAIFSRVVLLVFGTLYPAYASYKAVRTKNVKEYVKWMMYWIVFAFFTCIETFTDILFSWFPFYYEIKVVIVLWLLSPTTRGSSTLYRKFVHPMLTRREQEIDDYINQAKEKGYTAVFQLGSKGVNYATNVIMQTAIKAFNTPQMPGMIRQSHSENALVSVAMHGSSHSYRLAADTPNDNLTSQVDGSGPSAGSVSRVRRSHSADSALNRATTRSQANTRNHSIIYEMDSEEEESLLAEAQAAIEQNQFSLSDTVDSVQNDGDTDFEKASSVESDVGSARSRTVQKRKNATATTATGARSRRAASSTSSALTNGGTTTTKTTRGRKKLRQDSESMDVEVD